jgi:hypothetical protein
MQSKIPLLFNRFKYTMLGFSFLKEKIIYNNSLSSFNEDYGGLGNSLDLTFIDMSMENERELTNMKISYPSIVGSMVDLLKLSDSEMFCYKIIGSADSGSQTSDELDSNINSTYAYNKIKPY